MIIKSKPKSKLISYKDGYKYRSQDNDLIHSIYLHTEHIVLENRTGQIRKVIFLDELRQELDNNSFAYKIAVLQSEQYTNSKMLLVLINYFTGKRYRIARPIGHGNEQIVFIKNNNNQD